MGDSSRPHELPLASPLVASDGHMNDRRRGSNAETTSKNTAIGQHCSECNISLAKKAKSMIKRSQNQIYCNKCYYRERPASQPNNDTDSESDEESDNDSDDADEPEPMSQDEAQITINVKCSFSYNERCIFRSCPVNSTRTRINTEARIQALRSSKTFIPKGARCCLMHLAGRLFKSDALLVIPINESLAQFRASQIDEMINLLIKPQKVTNEFEQMQSDRLKVFTGRSRDQFLELASSLVVSSKFESKRTLILGVYLTTLYAGFTQEQISATFMIKQQSVSNYIKRCRSNLHDFVMNNVGLNVFTRAKMIQHRTNNVEALYNLQGTNSVVTVWDATYEYLPKSSNFRFQAATYSSNKKRNLLKPMVAVTPDGMIVDIFGPDTLWSATKSDAKILKQLMKLDSFRDRFEAGDVFVVDRGFRDVKQELENRNFVVKIPPHLVKGQKQLTTAQANIQRQCTAVRWIVEVVNHQLKCNKYLAKTLGVQSVPYLLEDTRIAAAIHNKYGTRMFAYNDDTSVTTRIISRAHLENNLKAFVDLKELTRKRVTFQDMNGDLIPEFPELNPVELRTMVGTYHLSLAASYYGDHVDGESGYLIQVMKDNSFKSEDFKLCNIDVVQPLFIRVRLQSRHSREKIYQAYLLCDLSKSGLSSLIGYCCQCLQGLRTVSPCALLST